MQDALVISISEKKMYKYQDIHQQEAATRGVLLEKLFLEISQNSQKTSARVFFSIKLQSLGLQLY